MKKEYVIQKKTNRNSEEEEPAPTEPKKHKKRFKIIVTILAIIILGIIYLYLTYGSIPSALLSGKQINATEIESLMFQKLNSTNTVGLTYSGSVVINNTDPNVSISYLKYYNDTRTSFSFTGFPILGNVSDIAVSLDNGTQGYGCIKSWNSTAGEQKPYTCVNATGMTNSKIAYALNLIADGSTLGNITVNSYGLSAWNAQPCYSATGTGSINVNSAIIGRRGYVKSNFNFTACLSAQYDVPFTLEGVMSLPNRTFIHVNIFQTGIDFNTTLAQVTSLPNQV